MPERVVGSWLLESCMGVGGAGQESQIEAFSTYHFLALEKVLAVTGERNERGFRFDASHFHVSRKSYVRGEDDVASLFVTENCHSKCDPDLDCCHLHVEAAVLCRITDHYCRGMASLVRDKERSSRRERADRVWNGMGFRAECFPDFCL